MKDAQYRKRVERDLDDWISNGLVPETSRPAILDSLPASGTGDGRGWLAMAATILAGLAVITFIGDNWAAIPRGLKLVLLITLFLSAAIGSAWFHRTSEKISNGLALLSALIFAASIALLGQAFNMPGSPSGAILASAFAASLIGLSARSAAASFAALVFGGIWIVMGLDDALTGWQHLSFWAINAISLSVGLNAWRIRSRALWHGLILSGIALTFIHIGQVSSLLTGNGLDLRRADDEEMVAGVAFCLMATLWAGLSWLGIIRDTQDKGGGRTLAGYGSWVALGNIALIGFPMADQADILHRFVWLAASCFCIWLGPKSHYGWITTASVVSLITAIFVIFIDLGMTLSVAALIFTVAAIVGMIAVFLMKKTSNSKRAEV